mgnify:CR=1 FL=1
MGKNKQQVPRLRFPGFNDAWEQRKFKELVFLRSETVESQDYSVDIDLENCQIRYLKKEIFFLESYGLISTNGGLQMKKVSKVAKSGRFLAVKVIQIDLSIVLFNLMAF